MRQYKKRICDPFVERPTWSKPRGANPVEQTPWSGPRGTPVVRVKVLVCHLCRPELDLRRPERLPARSFNLLLIVTVLCALLGLWKGA